jgi:hypothetical protein
MRRLDAIIVGAGQAGPPLAGPLTIVRRERRLAREDEDIFAAILGASPHPYRLL